jgi:alkylhydroperoxidase/carboxymuconolactone decarboxylase family protein YurZ
MNGNRPGPHEQAHDRLAEQIPWLVRGELPAARRAELEEHVATCEECRALLETAQELSEAAPDLSDRLLEHPEARLLDEYAFRPEALDESLRAWIAAHLKACEACGEAVAMLHRSAQQTRAEPPRRTRSGGRLPRLLSRTILHPAAAAVYLVAALVLLPFAVRESREVTSPGAGTGPETPRLVGPAFRLFPDEPFRGEEPAEPEPTRQLLVDPEATVVRLDLITDLDVVEWPEAGWRLRVAAEGGDEVLAAPLGPDDVSPLGLVSVEIPTGQLIPLEPYRVQIRRAAGAAPPLFETRFTIARRTAPNSLQVPD